jgi:hypothetical protein
MPIELRLTKADLENVNGLWDVHQGAAFLGVSHWAMRRYVSEGLLKGHRVGNRLMFDPKELKAVLRQVSGRTKRSGAIARATQRKIDGLVAAHAQAAVIRWHHEMLKIYAGLSAEELASLQDWELRRDPATQGSTDWPGFAQKIGKCPWGGTK